MSEERVYWDSYLERSGTTLHVWEFTSPNTIQYRTENWKPYVYQRAHLPTGDPNSLRSLEGHEVTKVEYRDYMDMVEKMKAVEGDDRFCVYENGFVPPEIGHIGSQYRNNPDWILKPRILYFDIEVHSESGFPLPEVAKWPVVSFSVCRSWEDDKMFVYGLKPIEGTGFCLPENGTYIHCESEEHLLIAFLFECNGADVIAGWYSNQFDFPYLINRMKNICAMWEKKLAKFKPAASTPKSDPAWAEFEKQRDARLPKGFNFLNQGFACLTPAKRIQFYKSMDPKTHRDTWHIKIPGKACIDLLELYKKYTRESLPSYGLDFVGKHEFGEGKLKLYADKGNKELSLVHMYHHEWNSYLAYNLRDVALTRDIDRKRALIGLVLEVAKIARIPLDRTTFMSAIVDGALLQSLRDKNLVAPGSFHTKLDLSYTGGFVKTPICVWGRRFYKHTAVIDVTSEYPSAIVKLNISPETFVGRIELPVFKDLRLSALTRNILSVIPKEGELTLANMRGETKVPAIEIRQKLESLEYCISGDGCLFINSPQGAFSSFTEQGFGHRRALKRKFQEHRDNYDRTGDEIEGEKAAYYNTGQNGWKLILNSAYGQMGSTYSRLYNPFTAQAITSTGVNIVMNGERFINEFFTQRYLSCQPELVAIVQRYNPSIKEAPFWDRSIADRVVTMDTDSCILTLDDMVAHVLPDLPWPIPQEDQRAVSLIDDVMQLIVGQLNEYLNTEFAGNRLRSTAKFRLGFEHEGEKVSYGSIFLAKKKYILRRGLNGKLKVTGFELKKVNICEGIRKELENSVHFIMEHGPVLTMEMMLAQIVNISIRIHRELTSGSPQEIASRLSYSVGVNELDKYRGEGNELFRKGTPIHCKAALIHNHLVQTMGMTIPEIYAGERIRVLKCVAPVPKWNAIAYKEILPAEFGDGFKADAGGVIMVDYVQKVQKLIDAFGWAGQLHHLLKKLNKKPAGQKIATPNVWMEVHDSISEGFVHEMMRDFDPAKLPKRLIAAEPDEADDEAGEGFFHEEIL